MTAPSTALSAQLRTIAVPADKKWKHAETGLIVPQSLAGLPRTTIQDSTDSELDIFVQFGDQESEALTLYVFRPSIMDVPIWFDRAETQILLRNTFGKPAPSSEPVAFAPPQGSTASALRRVYTPGKPPYTATGVALIPLGEWLVTIRFSSRTLSPAALDARIDAVIAGLQWPAASAQPGAVAAVPVKPCASSLTFAAKAKPKKPDMTMALIGAVLVQSDAGKADDKQAEPQVFCREGANDVDLSAYRQADDMTGYLIALGDAGRSISVRPELLLPDKRPGYAVTFNDLAISYVYPSFDKLPEPARALELVRKASPISSASRKGKEITLQEK